MENRRNRRRDLFIIELILSIGGRNSGFKSGIERNRPGMENFIRE